MIQSQFIFATVIGYWSGRKSNADVNNNQNEDNNPQTKENRPRSMLVEGKFG